MWRMICTTTPVTVTIEGIEADDRSGRARIVDEHTFSDTKFPAGDRRLQGLAGRSRPPAPRVEGGAQAAAVPRVVGAGCRKEATHG